MIFKTTFESSSLKPAAEGDSGNLPVDQIKSAFNEMRLFISCIPRKSHTKSVIQMPRIHKKEGRLWVLMKTCPRVPDPS